MTHTEASEVSVSEQSSDTVSSTMVYPCMLGSMIDDPAFNGLVAEYAEECKMRGMPEPEWAREMYEGMEQMGIVQGLVLRDLEFRMVGFSVLFCTVVPHYSKLVVTTESLFVTKEHRKGGGGMKLIRAIEGHAKNIGAVGLLLSAPEGGSLAQVAPKIGYTHASNVFLRGLHE